MARKLRLEYPGAIYHVINRGNYRRPIFQDDKTKKAFEGCLFEACEKSAWILHSFVVMGNHYHLTLETPQGNLIAGMHWLQGTFANRFNRFRKEHGHLFQYRYKAILVDHGKPLGETCDYHHLNPALAKILPFEQLTSYCFSSYWYLHHPRRRPGFLKVQTALECAGGLPDTAQGWKDYAARLELQLEELVLNPGEARRKHRLICSGWAFGPDEFKAALVKEYQLVGDVRAWENPEVQHIRQLRWEAALTQGLQALGRQPAEALLGRKSAPWKLALAAWLKARTQVSNRWLSVKLHLGVPTAISHNLTLYRRDLQASDPAWRKLKSI
jgi:putative transposase